jgi:hypothetical protein
VPWFCVAFCDRGLCPRCAFHGQPAPPSPHGKSRRRLWEGGERGQKGLVYSRISGCCRTKTHAGPTHQRSDRPATARAERGLRAIDAHPSVRGRVDVRALGHFWRPTFGDDSATGGPYGGRGVQFSASAGASKLHPRRAGTTIIARRAPVSQDKKYDSVQSLTTIDLDTGSQPLARRERELMQAFSTTTRSASDCVGPTNRHRGEGR